MAANTTPIFPESERHTCVDLSAANTARDGTGTLPVLWTAGADGSVIYSLRLHAQVTTTAGMIRLFLDDDGAGTNITLVEEIPVSAITPSGTVPAWYAESSYFVNRRMKAGSKLYGGTHNAETFGAVTEGGDY